MKELTRLKCMCSILASEKGAKYSISCSLILQGKKDTQMFILVSEII